MSEQARPDWYPDGHGKERYWDGSSWTEQIRTPGKTEAAGDANAGARKDGAFSKLGAAVKKAAAEKKAAKEELGFKHFEDAQAAGALVTSGYFGTSTVEIYDSGYVRIASDFGDSTPRPSSVLLAPRRRGISTRPTRISTNTPYEKLRSMKYTPSDQDKNSGRTSSLEDAVGPAVAGLIKGGRAAFKGSVPGLVAASVSHVATAGSRRSFLTITTDKQIHTLLNESSKGHNEVGLALEAVGNAVLGVAELAAQEQPMPEPQPASEPQPVLVSQAAAGPTLAERLRELADLHKDGILSDDEFAAAKAKVLGGL